MIGCRPLTQDEIVALMRAIPTYRDRVLFKLLLYTGFRISEALSLKVEDVQQGERVVVKKRHMKGKPQSRAVLIHPQLRLDLDNYIRAEGLPLQSPLFPSRKGGHLGVVGAWQVLDSAIRRAGLQGKVSFHSARKTFAEQVHEFFGHDLVKTSKALGHKSVLSTASYLSFKTEEMDAAVLSLGHK